MELLTPHLRQVLPPLDSQRQVADPVCYCHFFLPDTNWDWYPIEFDGIEIFYGWSSFVIQELCTFYLSELRVIRGLEGKGVLRDIRFQPLPLSQVQRRHLPSNEAKARTVPDNGKGRTLDPLFVPSFSPILPSSLPLSQKTEWP